MTAIKKKPGSALFAAIARSMLCGWGLMMLSGQVLAEAITIKSYRSEAKYYPHESIVILIESDSLVVHEAKQQEYSWSIEVDTPQGPLTNEFGQRTIFGVTLSQGHQPFLKQSTVSYKLLELPPLSIVASKCVGDYKIRATLSRNKQVLDQQSYEFQVIEHPADQDNQTALKYIQRDNLYGLNTSESGRELTRLMNRTKAKVDAKTILTDMAEIARNCPRSVYHPYICKILHSAVMSGKRMPPTWPQRTVLLEAISLEELGTIIEKSAAANPHPYYSYALVQHYAEKNPVTALHWYDRLGRGNDFYPVFYQKLQSDHERIQEKLKLPLTNPTPLQLHLQQSVEEF
jgi:hypothetical protein